MRFPATVEMVQAWLPHSRIDDDSEPSREQVQQQLETFDDDVYFAVGNLALLEADTSKGAFVSALMAQAARVVALGTASVVWHSRNPEGVDPADGTSYGSVLWKRYQALLKNLQEAATRGSDIPDQDLAPSAGAQWWTPSATPSTNTQGRPLFVDVLDPNLDSPYASGLTC